MIYVNFEIQEMKKYDGKGLTASLVLNVLKEWLATSRERIILTYTEGGFWGAGSAQFRVWKGIPARFEEGHVDSCGENLLLHVSGDHWSLREFRDQFAAGFPHLRPVTLPNRVLLYLHTC